MLLAVCLGLLTLPAGSPAGADAPPIRQAVDKSLNFLEKNGATWMRERGCVSCHSVGMMIWAHNEARRRGWAVPAEKTRAWTDWALVDLLARGKEAGGADVISQLLLGRERSSPWRVKPPLVSRTADPFESLWDALVEQQRPSGSWKPGPQLHSPPEVTTRWALLALDSRDSTPDKSPAGSLADLVKKLDARIPESRKAALAWLKEEPPDDSLEARILRMLVMRKIEPALAQIWLLELMDLQKADGGWSYQKNAAGSDAFATGLALYAAMLQGHPQDNAQIRRAQEYLLKTMNPDGSWTVPTSAIHAAAAGKNTAGSDAIYSYWGTAWATLGLLHTLPEAAQASARAPRQRNDITNAR